MSKWLQAARTARASKPDLGPFYAHANSANSANRSRFTYTGLSRANSANRF